MSEAPKVRVYEKPTCTTCKNLVMLLKEKGIEFEAIDYTIEPIPRDKLQVLLQKMGGNAYQLVRSKEAEYRLLGLDKPGLPDDRILDILAQYPKLVQRPIVELPDKAIVARPIDRVNEIL